MRAETCHVGNTTKKESGVGIAVTARQHPYIYTWICSSLRDAKEQPTTRHAVRQDFFFLACFYRNASSDSNKQKFARLLALLIHTAELFVGS